jgi:hypothetical protein
MKYLLTFLFIISIISFTIADDKINKGECELCDMIVYRIDLLIKNNKSNEIPLMLANLCYRTSFNYRSNCEIISYKYIEIIDLLENNKNKNLICEKLDFCNISYYIDEDNIICEYIYYSLLNKINIIKNDNLDNIIKNTCKKFPIEYIPKCENIYVSYFEYFKESIENSKSSYNTCLDIYYSLYFGIKIEEYTNYEKLRDL